MFKYIKIYQFCKRNICWIDFHRNKKRAGKQYLKTLVINTELENLIHFNQMNNNFLLILNMYVTF
jgi:hypothetical protein